MSRKCVPAAVHRYLYGFHEWMAEQQGAARQRYDQARAQAVTLEQLFTPALPMLAKKNPPPPAQPAPPQAANPVLL